MHAHTFSSCHMKWCSTIVVTLAKVNTGQQIPEEMKEDP